MKFLNLTVLYMVLATASAAPIATGDFARDLTNIESVYDKQSPPNYDDKGTSRSYGSQPDSSESTGKDIDAGNKQASQSKPSSQYKGQTSPKPENSKNTYNSNKSTGKDTYSKPSGSKSSDHYGAHTPAKQASNGSYGSKPAGQKGAQTPTIKQGSSSVQRQGNKSYNNAQKGGNTNVSDYNKGTGDSQPEKENDQGTYNKPTGATSPGKNYNDPIPVFAPSTGKNYNAPAPMASTSPFNTSIEAPTLADTYDNSGDDYASPTTAANDSASTTRVDSSDNSYDSLATTPVDTPTATAYTSPAATTVNKDDYSFGSDDSSDGSSKNTWDDYYS